MYIYIYICIYIYVIYISYTYHIHIIYQPRFPCWWAKQAIFPGHVFTAGPPHRHRGRLHAGGLALERNGFAFAEADLWDDGEVWNLGGMNQWLVGGLEHELFYFPIYEGNVIIPIDELIFFRGVDIPPTRQCCRSYQGQTISIRYFIWFNPAWRHRFRQAKSHISPSHTPRGWPCVGASTMDRAGIARVQGSGGTLRYGLLFIRDNDSRHIHFVSCCIILSCSMLGGASSKKTRNNNWMWTHIDINEGSQA